MKIIENGRKVNLWVGTKIECEKCNCVIELEVGDKVSYTYYSGNVATISCPSCSTDIIFTNKEKQKNIDNVETTQKYYEDGIIKKINTGTTRIDWIWA